MTKLIILDWNRTLFDPDTRLLYSEVSDFVEKLRGNILVLVSVAEGSNPREFLKNARLEQYFSEVIISVDKVKLFSRLLEKYQCQKNWVIGDRLDSEILAGNILGFSTIWIRHGKYANFIPMSRAERPNYEVDNLLDCLPILFS